MITADFNRIMESVREGLEFDPLRGKTIPRPSSEEEHLQMLDPLHWKSLEPDYWKSRGRYVAA
jgi:hypothetical protein